MIDVRNDPDRDAMRDLFERAKASQPALCALDRLVYCHMLNRITDGNLTVALDQFADEGTVAAALAELEQLSEDEQAELIAEIAPVWNQSLSFVVIQLWRTCRQLGFDPAGINADYVALFASLFIAGKIEPVDGTADTSAPE
jgi:hypothetical protein